MSPLLAPGSEAVDKPLPLREAPPRLPELPGPAPRSPSVAPKTHDLSGRPFERLGAGLALGHARDHLWHDGLVIDLGGDCRAPVRRGRSPLDRPCWDSAKGCLWVRACCHGRVGTGHPMVPVADVQATGRAGRAHEGGSQRCCSGSCRRRQQRAAREWLCWQPRCLHFSDFVAARCRHSASDLGVRANRRHAESISLHYSGASEHCILRPLASASEVQAGFCQVLKL